MRLFTFKHAVLVLTIVASILVATFAPALTATVSASSAVTEYPVPSSLYGPAEITPGSDGALWFTNYSSNNAIGRIALSGSISYYQIPVTDIIRAITTGSDGALWFTVVDSTNGNAGIGRMTTSGNFNEYSIPSRSPNFISIAASLDGSLWFTEYGGANQPKIGHMLSNGSVSEYNVGISNEDAVSGITVDSSGNAWFTDYWAGKIGQISPTGRYTLYTIPSTNPFPLDITTGPDGALWFTNENGNSIGRITTTGSITIFPLPVGQSQPERITTGSDGALWFTEENANKIGRITTSGSITEYPIPTSGSAPYDIVTGPDGALWFTEENANQIGRISISPVPATPTNLTVQSPTQVPTLTWDTAVDAASYNIYRNDTQVASSITPTYTDNAAPEGANSYYVTAIGPGGDESQPSNTVSVLVDRTPPTITYSVNPSPNSNGWNSTPVTVSFTCADTGSGVQFCSGSQTESTDRIKTVVGIATDNAGNTDSTSVTVKLDLSPPALGAPSWTANPVTTAQSSSVTIPVSDNLSGVARGEYYLGTVDPGVGAGIPMSLVNNALSVTFAAGSLTPGIYQLNIRAQDVAGNWSPVEIDYLVVYNPENSGVEGHSNHVLPVYGVDILPGLTQPGQSDPASFALSVRYSNGTLIPSSKVHFAYNTGSQCNSAQKATNCHSLTLDSGSIAWLVISGNNNSQATVQGTGTLTIDGTTTTNPFRVVVTDGSLLSSAAIDTFAIQIFTPGASPSTSTPIYTLSESLTSGNVTVNE